MNELTNQLKAAMEYVEVPVVRCNGCAYANYGDDFGGGHRWVCRLNPAHPFEVQPHGRCKHHCMKTEESKAILARLREQLETPKREN